jgi:hypothetical protein
MVTPSGPKEGGESQRVVVRIYLRLFDLDGEEIAVLARDDPTLVVVPRIGEEYVTAAAYGVPVTGVEHDTIAGEHHVAVFLDEQVEDADRLITLHADSGWVLVRDERPSDEALDRPA